MGNIYAVAKAAQIGVGAINVWQQRGLIPGIVSRGAGRRRHLDLDTAVHVGVMATLARMGVGPTPASDIAAECLKHSQRYLLVLNELPPCHPDLGVSPTVERELRETVRRAGLSTTPFDRLDELDGFFAKFYRHPPSSFAIVDIATIRAIMQAIEDEIERDEPAGELAVKRRRRGSST